MTSIADGIVVNVIFYERKCYFMKIVVMKMPKCFSGIVKAIFKMN